MASSRRTVISKVALILLECLDGTCHSLTEIAAATGLPLSTTHRLVRDLATWRILERTADGRYGVGLALRRIAARGFVVDLRARAPHVLADLVQVFDAEARLGVLDDHHVAYLAHTPGHRFATTVAPAAPLPAHATAMGKALLAFSPPDVVAAVVARGLTAYTPFSVTTPDRLHRILARIRLRRVAVSRWELERGRSALAVPVFGPGGNVAAAIELQVDDPDAAMPTVGPALAVAACSLTRELADRPVVPAPAGIWHPAVSMAPART